MKNIRLSNFSLMLISAVLSLSCYEPIANTSGAADTEAERENKNINIPSEKPEVREKTELPKTNEVTKTETMKEGKKKDNVPIKTTEGFQANLNQNLSKAGLSVSDIYDSSNPVERRILKEYGSVFLTKAMPPSEVMFTSESAVSEFQSKAGSGSANIGGANIKLQPAALRALKNAVEEAKSSGLSITPRDKKTITDSAKRSYGQTLELWNSRFNKACEHWKGKGRLTSNQISKLKSLPIKQQVQEVLELEKKGIYFNTFFNNSILYSVAAPGTSQHISMLAFDVAEFQSKRVRKILAKQGWFRTVQNDEPHFTYLGHKEEDLPKLGLKKVFKKDGEFWIPNM